MAKINIGVTGTGSLIGQALIKSINDSVFSRRISLIGFDYFNGTVGARWVTRTLLLPDYLNGDIGPDIWLKKVIEYLRQEEIKLLFIGLDFELKLFSKYKETIESQTSCKVIVSNPQVVEIADDKYLTYRFLKDNGFYYPRTLLPEELGKEEIDFPCVLKPRCGYRSRDVFIVTNAQELEKRLSWVDKPLIQERIGSENDEYTCGVIYLDTELKAMIALKRQLKDGNTVTATYSKDTPEIIYNYIRSVTLKLRPLGPCNFQLRMNQEGIPKIFEINARFSGTTHIRAMFGFRETEYILAYFLGSKPKRFVLREGTVKRYYDEMFIGRRGIKL